MANIREITIIDKATHARAVASASGVIVLPGQSIVELPLPRAQIASLARQGDALVVTTVSGEVIVMQGFFAAGQAGHSELAVQGDGGGSVLLADLSNDGVAQALDALDPAANDGARDGVNGGTNGGTYGGASAASNTGDAGDAVLAQAPAPAPDAVPAAGTGAGAGAGSDAVSAGAGANTGAGAGADAGPGAGAAAAGEGASASSAWLPLAAVWGGLIAAVAISRSDDGPTTTKPAGSGAASGTSSSATHAAPTIAGVSQNASGTLTVSGHASPGDQVTVTWPDNSTVSATANADGLFTATSAQAQGAGSVVVADANASGSASQVWTGAPPQAPTVSVAANGDGGITVSGTAAPGSIVSVTYPDGTSVTATADAVTGSYSVTTHAVQGVGDVAATATDAAGNASPATDVAYTPPVAAVPVPAITAIAPDTGTGAGASDFITKAGAIAISGTLSRALPGGETLQISLDGGQTWQTVSNVSGTSWRYDNTASVLPDGSYTVEARVAGSVSGNALGAVVTQQVVVDSTAPTEGISYAGDQITASGQIIFHGSLSAALNGAGGSSEYVQVSTDGGNTWSTAQVSGTAWSYNAGALTSSTTYDVIARVADAAGNVGNKVEQSVTVTGGPPVPTVSIIGITPDTAPQGTPTGSALYSDFITDVKTFTVDGALSTSLGAGQTVQILVDGAAAGTATVNAAGTGWSYAIGSALKDGSHAITAEVADASGNLIGSAVTQNVVVDTIAPVEGIQFGDGGDRVHTTNIPPPGSPTDFYGTLSQPLNGAGGSSEYVQVSTNGGQTWNTAQVDGTNWGYTANLFNGTYDVIARVVDAAGNVGNSVEAPAFTVNNEQMPMSISPDTAPQGTPAGSPLYSDGITDASTLTITGTSLIALVAGQTVQILVDGTAVGTATVNAAGTDWSYTASALKDGSHVITAEVVDASGGSNMVYNTYGLATQTVVVDTVAPTEGITYGGDMVISSGQTVFYGNLSAALNGAGGSTEFVQVSTDGGQTWNAAQVSGTTWTYSATGLTSGTYDVQARVVDAAGNLGQVATQSVAVESGGNLAIMSNAATNDSTPNIVVWVKSQFASDAVQVSTDGGQTWDAAQRLPSTGAIPSTGTDTDPSWLGAASWTYSPATALQDGAYMVEARVVDASGQQVGSAATQQLVVDTVAPTETISGIAAASDGTGISGALSAPLVNVPSGGVSPESVQVSTDGGTTWQTATATGTAWSLPESTPLPAGLYAVQAHVTDAAGNVGPTVTQQVVVAPDGKLDLNLQDVLHEATSLGQRVMIGNAGANNGLTVTLAEGIGAGASQWQDTGTTTVSGVTYDVYHNAQMGSSTTADLLIQHGMAVN